MSDFGAFLQLGFQHITDVRGLDHVLFLLALAAIYRPSDWREVLRVITAFTIGHSITLALAVTGVLDLPTALIEFLIPITIVATAVENIVVRDRQKVLGKGYHRPVFAAIFGLVHGAGFANYLRSLFVDDLAVPLLGFNVGLEVGQVAVLMVTFVAFAGLDALIGRIPLPRVHASPLRVRVFAVSSVVALVAAVWAAERSPW
ncbi:MAG: HupE/UreJ family protein [Gemmatimonadetes bacterium]|nr:HupE/UreJ family protein [Gemmatimonadota bacterium]